MKWYSQTREAVGAGPPGQSMNQGATGIRRELLVEVAVLDVVHPLGPRCIGFCPAAVAGPVGAVPLELPKALESRPTHR